MHMAHNASASVNMHAHAALEHLKRPRSLTQLSSYIGMIHWNDAGACSPNGSPYDIICNVRKLYRGGLHMSICCREDTCIVISMCHQIVPPMRTSQQFPTASCQRCCNFTAASDCTACDN